MKRPDKTQLLKKYAAARAELRTFIASLSESQLTLPTDESGWTVKDHLVHLAVWEDGVRALLQRKPRWTAMGLSANVAEAGDVDAMNEQIRQKSRDMNMKQVLKYFDEVDKRFTAVVSKMSVTALHTPYAYYAKIRKPSEQESEPVFGWVEGNSWHHIEEHAAVDAADRRR